jgi:hypothetical protein
MCISITGNSDNNIICGNNLSSPRECGLFMYNGCDCNKIIGNDFYRCRWGLYIEDAYPPTDSNFDDTNCHRNEIYNNNFIDNKCQAHGVIIYLKSIRNQWDAGPIKGGNYWSDHEVGGVYYVGGREYFIHFDIDRYPLSEPFSGEIGKIKPKAYPIIPLFGKFFNQFLIQLQLITI